MSDHTDDNVTPEPERPAAFTGKGEGSKAPLVPKNVQKLATRTLILLLAVAAIIFGLQWWRNKGDDLDLGGADTKGNILALQLLEDGSRVVVIRPDGTVVESAAYRPGAVDRDAVWYPSGNRVLFVSDRKEGTTHIYRWNPGKNDDPQQKTVDESSRGEIAFAAQNVSKPDESALVATRGNIEEFFPGESRSVRVLPPSLKDVSVGEEQGVQSTFTALYSRIGTSFRTGRWSKDKTIVAAVMRRGEDGGEVLVLQSLVLDDKGVLPPPRPIVAGERIDIDVSPATGDLAFSVSMFDYPTDEETRRNTKDGKVNRPFRHAVGTVDLSDASMPKIAIIVASPEDTNAFGPPVFSPDGEKLLVTVGTWDESALKTRGLVSAPTKPNSGTQGALIVQGEIYEPSWSPQGDRIVYVKRQNGRREIFLASADGTGETSVTGEKGDFASPKFSPQQ